MHRVVHFEITADDPDRAAAFYKKAFGWDFREMGGPFKYLLATTGRTDQPGIDGAIMERQDHKQAVINTLGVDSWEASAKAIKDAGGLMLGEKHAVPSLGWIAYFKDTEGNIVGIFQNDKNAK